MAITQYMQATYLSRNQISSVPLSPLLQHAGNTVTVAVFSASAFPPRAARGERVKDVRVCVCDASSGPPGARQIDFRDLRTGWVNVVYHRLHFLSVES